MLLKGLAGVAHALGISKSHGIVPLNQTTTLDEVRPNDWRKKVKISYSARIIMTRIAPG